MSQQLVSINNTILSSLVIVALIGCNVVTHSDGDGGAGSSDSDCDDGVATGQNTVGATTIVSHAVSVGITYASTGVSGTAIAVGTTGSGVQDLRLCYIGDGTCVSEEEFDTAPYADYLGCSDFDGEVTGSSQEGNTCCYFLVGDCPTP